LTLNHNELLSSFAFKFNLRRYISDVTERDAAAAAFDAAVV